MELISLLDVLTYRKRRSGHSDYRFGGWYMIRNINNGKAYIGKSIECIERMRNHATVKNPRVAIDVEIKLHGAESFEFYVVAWYTDHSIDFFNRKEEVAIENRLIGTHKTLTPNGYNMRHYENL